MLFKYKAVDGNGTNQDGEIDAPSKDTAISGLQRRGFVVISITEEGEKKSLLQMSFFNRVTNKEVVILSRQVATLFEAQVSALKAFTMLADNTENKFLGSKLSQVCEDLKAGSSISGALSKHPDVFSNFYLNMVKVGEETGKLNQIFLGLASYLDRQYALTSKTRNALIFLAMLGVWLWRLAITEQGKMYIDRTRLSIPYVGNLYKQLYLSRIADNLDIMLTSGIQIIRAIDITAEVVGSYVYKDILIEVADGVKSGMALSAVFEKHPKEIPSIMVQMIKVGEETGSLGTILGTLTAFYRREVDDAVDTLVGLIEPVMIVALGMGVGVLLVSILVPIYNLAGGIT